VLAVPDQTVHRTKRADWVELRAISSPDARIGFGTLVSGTALTENDQEENIADEDIAEEELVLGVQNEIARRAEVMGADYPFRIDDKGRALEFITPVSQVGSVYLFCLFLSHACDRTIMPKKLAPKVTNKTRDLFQACSTLAAGGFVEGPSKSFGFPRPDGTTFLAALHTVYELFGDGTPRARPRAAAAKKIKDNGIDIIAWKRSVDGLPCTLYVIGQVASGKNWEEKSVMPDRVHFHQYWFTTQPASQPHDAMFMPFGLEPEDPEDGTPYADVLKDYMQSIGYAFGTLFYRDRIVKLSAKGLQLVAAGELEIDRYKDLGKIIKWVEGYTKRLKAA
jgi:hypothetical protein